MRLPTNLLIGEQSRIDHLNPEAHDSYMYIYIYTDIYAHMYIYTYICSCIPPPIYIRLIQHPANVMGSRYTFYHCRAYRNVVT